MIERNVDLTSRDVARSAPDGLTLSDVQRRDRTRAEPLIVRGGSGLLGSRKCRAEQADLRARHRWQARLSPVASGGFLADQLACR
jgi:hypothetical protein